MPLVLRDLATNRTIEIPNEGQTIGREGGNADVQLKDPGVSNRHARIFADGEAWLVQDLGSSNGTWLGELRIAETTEIRPNDLISIANTRLEVVRVWDPKLQQTLLMQAAPVPDTLRSVAAVSKAPDAESAAAPTILYSAQSEAPTAAEAQGNVGDEPAADRPEEAAAQAQTAAPEAGGGQDKGLKYFLVAVPRAVAFYLAAIPLMIVNPIGTIRKGVADQKHETKERMELIAYALPVNLFSAAVGFISTLIVQLVTHTVSIGGLLVGLLVIPAIVAVVASAITGFAWHPVTAWIITKLKGESDARSRTNYFLMFMTATALVVLPGGIGTVLGLVPFRLIAAVQPILSALGSVVVIFVTYSWMAQFNVVKWFRTVLLVLGGLAVVGGGFGVLGRLTTAPAGSGIAAAPDADARVAAAQAQAEEAGKAAAEAGADATAAAKEAAADRPSAKAAAPATAPAEESGSYATYLQMRDAVEKNIADDPASLNRTPGLLAQFREYTSATFEVDSKYKTLTEKTPADAKLNVRLREAELFEKTEKLVKELYGKLKLPALPVAGSGKQSPKPKESPPAASPTPAADAKPKAEPVAKEEKPKAEPKPEPVAKEEKPKAAEPKPKPEPVAKEEKPKAAEPKPKPEPVAKEEKPKAEPKPKPEAVAKEEKPKAEPKPAEAKPAVAKGKGKLACSSKPTDAEVWVDGKNTGKRTPVAVSSALELPAGKHTVIFKHNGKASAPVEITIEADQPAVVLKGVEIPGG